jgi:hypothetical protein
MINREKYSPERIDRLQNYLKTYSQRGEPLDYEVIVDGFKAVRRTNDPELFQLYEEHVSHETQSISVLLYAGSSRNCDKSIFYFNEIPEVLINKQKSLNGLDIEERINAALAEERKKIKSENLIAENAELKEEIKELEKENEELSAKLEELYSSQSPLKSMVGEVGSVMVESFIRRNPAMLAKIPGGSALSGLLESDMPQPAAIAEPEAEISFAPKSQTPPSIGEEEKAAIEFVGQLQERFTQEEFNEILAVLECFADDKSRIKSTLQILNPSENE